MWSSISRFSLKDADYIKRKSFRLWSLRAVLRSICKQKSPDWLLWVPYLIALIHTNLYMITLKGRYHGRKIWVCFTFYRRFFIGILGILKKWVYTTNQHQKYHIFLVQNFFQSLRLTLDRVLHAHHVLVKINKSAIKLCFLHRSAISTPIAHAFKKFLQIKKKRPKNDGEMQRTLSKALIDYPDQGERH